MFTFNVPVMHSTAAMAKIMENNNPISGMTMKARKSWNENIFIKAKTYRFSLENSHERWKWSQLCTPWIKVSTHRTNGWVGTILPTSSQFPSVCLKLGASIQWRALSIIFVYLSELTVKIDAPPVSSLKQPKKFSYLHPWFSCFGTTEDGVSKNYIFKTSTSIVNVHAVALEIKLVTKFNLLSPDCYRA